MPSSNSTLRRAKTKPKIARFVAALLDGQSQAQALAAASKQYRKLLATNPKAVNDAATKYAAKLEVRAAIKSALASVRPEDLMSAGQFMKHVIEREQLSVKNDNMTAAASFTRMLGQGIGVLKDAQVVVNEWKESDESILAKLAGDDPEKLAAVRTLLGKAGFEPRKEPESKGEVKH